MSPHRASGLPATVGLSARGPGRTALAPDTA